VHATSDGIVVVHHDPVIHARHHQKPSRRKIAEVSLAELADFPLADGARIPTLTETLDAVKAIFPAIRTGILENSRHVDPAAALSDVSAEDLWQEVDSIDQGIVESAHSVRARVIAWTANETKQWDRLYALGVDGICTDRIAELATYHWQVR